MKTTKFKFLPLTLGLVFGLTGCDTLDPDDLISAANDFGTQDYKTLEATMSAAGDYTSESYSTNFAMEIYFAIDTTTSGNYYYYFCATVSYDEESVTEEEEYRAEDGVYTLYSSQAANQGEKEIDSSEVSASEAETYIDTFFSSMLSNYSLVQEDIEAMTNDMTDGDYSKSGDNIVIKGNLDYEGGGYTFLEELLYVLDLPIAAGEEMYIEMTLNEYGYVEKISQTYSPSSDEFSYNMTSSVDISYDVTIDTSAKIVE